MRRLAILALACLPAAHAQPAPSQDAQFHAQYQQKYQDVAALRPDMLVEELRLRVELVASRGSQVGGASNQRRVRGFESTLLQGLQATLCAGGKRLEPAPADAVGQMVESVTAAAQSQRLRTVGADVAEISAIAQRLVESQDEQLCGLHSLDDVR
jgi:hypothetical protein